MFSQSNFHNFFGDMDNRAKQRNKMKAEIDTLLEDEATGVSDLFELPDTEKYDEIMNQMRWGSKKVV